MLRNDLLKRTWVLHVALALTLLALPGRADAQTAATPQTAIFTSDATTPQVIPSRFQDRVLVPATINGKLLWFELDTGAGELVLDTRVARSLGLTVDDGAVHADVDIGPLHAHNAELQVTTVEDKQDGLLVAGLLGEPFFRGNVVTIDFLHQQIIAHPNGSFLPASIRAVSAPLSIINTKLYVHAWFGKWRAAMLLDTGADRTYLFPRTSDNVSLVETGDSGGDVIGLNAPVTSGTQYQARSLAIGGLYIRNVQVRVAQHSGIFTSNVYADGILGRDILSFFAVTLDYEHSMVYFER